MGKSSDPTIELERTRKISIALKGRSKPVEVCQKISNTLIGHPPPANSYKKGHTPWNKGLTKETNSKLVSVSEKVTQSLLGKPGRHNKPHTEKTKEIIRKKNSTPENIKKAIQNLPIDSKGFLGKQHTLKSNQANSLAHQKLWDTSDYISAQMKGRKCKPNKKELILRDLLNTWQPNEWKYVGDGKVKEFIIGSKCPDFANTNGRKALIELFGDYWHQGEDPIVKINHYKQYGFDCLVIWEKELDELSSLQEKILNFNPK